MDTPCCEKCSGYFEHRIGSHSDDWGGESDNPCFCNKSVCRDFGCPCHTTPTVPTESWDKMYDACAELQDKQGELGLGDIADIHEDGTLNQTPYCVRCGADRLPTNQTMK